MACVAAAAQRTPAMAPTATPQVPSAYNVQPYDGTRTPPAEEVAQSIEQEPEVADLFSLAGGAVIGECGAPGDGPSLTADPPTCQ